MTLDDWRNVLWEIVEMRFYKPGFKLYLSFDDSILEEYLDNFTSYEYSGTPTDSLNVLIQSYIVQTGTSVIRLIRNPNGFRSRSNWRWVISQKKNERSYAIVFVAQQILAAERMKDGSYFKSYWKMFDIYTNDPRINPFNDSENSIRLIWNQLKKELTETLGVLDSEITFKLGKGSNKYRNLPISQSLLTEANLQLALNSKPDIGSLSDDRLYMELRDVKFTKSGKHKIFIDSLKNEIITQFREFLSRSHITPLPLISKRVKQPVYKFSPEYFVLYEEQELFEESVFHILTSETENDTEVILNNYLDSNILMFRSSDTEIRGSSNLIIDSLTGDFYLLGRIDVLEEITTHAKINLKIKDFEKYFKVKKIRLSNLFQLIYCYKIPHKFLGLNFESKYINFTDAFTEEEISFKLEGGICVNRSSNQYLIGYAPHSLIVNGILIDNENLCDFNYHTITLQEVFTALSKMKIAGRHLLIFKDLRIYIGLAESKTYYECPVFIRNNNSLKPKTLHDTKPESVTGEFISYNQLVISNSDDWYEKRERRFALLASTVIRREEVWIYTENDIVSSCLVLLSYLNLPLEYKSLLINKMKKTNTVPLSLYLDIIR